MIYRSDLISHFEWLAGSRYYDEVLDEALVAIAMTAHGHGHDLVEIGAAWTWAICTVERFELEDFVETARSHLAVNPAADPR